jgi:hypothetical protein
MSDNGTPIFLALSKISSELLRETGNGNFEIKLPFNSFIALCNEITSVPRESFELSCLHGDIIKVSLKNE